MAEAAALPTKEEWNRDSLIELAMEEADAKGIDQDQFVKVMACEIGPTWDAKVQSQYPVKGAPNGKEDSWGPFQINLPGKNVTRAQAQDPSFAIPWAATYWKEGHKREWSCYQVEEKNGWALMN